MRFTYHFVHTKILKIFQSHHQYISYIVLPGPVEGGAPPPDRGGPPPGPRGGAPPGPVLPGGGAGPGRYKIQWR